MPLPQHEPEDVVRLKCTHDVFLNAHALVVIKLWAKIGGAGRMSDFNQQLRDTMDESLVSVRPASVVSQDAEETIGLRLAFKT